MTAVVWLNLDDDSIVRGYWDQGFLEQVFAGHVWRLRGSYEHHEVRSGDPMPDLPGAIVVLPGRFHVDRVDEVNARLARLGWVLLIVTSDEESLFPFEHLRHPRLRLWLMTPDPAKKYDPAIRFLGEGFAADTTDILQGADMDARQVDVGFWGQITHPRRERLWKTLNDGFDHSRVFVAASATETFAGGLPRDEYLRSMANTKIAPAPAGPATADSFRFFEALEAGCLPIADSRADGQPEGYWDTLLLGYEDRGFPVLDDWNVLPGVVDVLLDGWPWHANVAQAWWQRYKRDLVTRLESDVSEISGVVHVNGLADLITVIMPTSPIPSHPSTKVIGETLDSIQDRLGDVPIVVAFDGIRDEQESRRADYHEYTSRFLRETNLFRAHVVPVVMDRHGHQANAARVALTYVRTPLVLFVEHDTPLVGAIPFDELAAVVLAGEANLIRLHHEASVLEPHRHLMLDHEPRDVMGVPLLGTIQWSQRPHLASTAFYRSLIRRYFGHRSRTMIEDVMHGVVQTAAREGGWGMFRLFMYAPEGDIKRSTHLDGRGDDPKFDDRFVIEYDGDVPEWAPRPTSEREVHRQPASHDDPGGDDLDDSGVAVESDSPEVHGSGRLPGGVDSGDGMDR